MWNEYPPDYFDKDVEHEGIVSLLGSCEIGDRGGKEEYTIGKVFGTTKQDLTWDEFIAKCPDDVFGICQKNKLLNKIQESADKIINEWLDRVDSNYPTQSEPVGTIVGDVTVNESNISFNFRCDYKFYYMHTIGQYWSEEEDWDKDDDILINVLNAAGWEEDYPDVWFDISFDDRDYDSRR